MTGAAPLKRLVAPGVWQRIELLSDLHLAENTPATAEALRRHLRRSTADALILLGDIFEVWVGDDARHEAYIASLVDALREASRERALFFMAGNRDFLLGPEMARDCGLHLLADPCVLEAFGQRLLLTHGDAWCLADEPYQRFRAQVRNPAWQQTFLSQPLAQRLQLARQMRQASEHKKSTQQSELWADLDEARCVEELRAHACTLLVNGHTHRPAVHALPGGLQRWVLSDWDLEGPSPRAELLSLSAQGLQRVPPVA